MVALRSSSTSFLQRLSRGPWPRQVIARLRDALFTLAAEVAATPGAVALIVFGSYARGDFGRKSDVDLLLLVTDPDLRRQFVSHVGYLESEFRLPMHLALLVADPTRPEELGPDLLHAIWTDGVVLHAAAATLSLLQPKGLEPWEVIRFSGGRLSASKRVEISRRLHGRGERKGVITPPGVMLGPGVILVPPTQAQQVREVLDEFGASYDVFHVWRPA